MNRSHITYKDFKYPTVTIEKDTVDLLGQKISTITIADIDLWFGIEEDYNEGDSTAIDIDKSIYHYCPSNFLANKPTDKEITDYLTQNSLI